MAKGIKTGGRAKGVPNKVTVAAKEAISMAFEQLGGVDSLVGWAAASDDNRKVFYAQIWPKIVPLQVAGDPDNPLALSLAVQFVRSDKPT